MNFTGLIYLIIAHFLCGRGLLKLFKLQLPPALSTCFSLMLGVPLLSLVPCFVQLLKIPITVSSVSMGIAIYTAVFCIPLLVNFKRPRLGKIVLPQIYELPFLAACLTLVALSLWRCYYYPPTARDMLSGPELLAQYAVREKTMINSVFTLDLHTTNNYFKSPYITCLQIIYKLLVQPFGQVWMSVLYIPFVSFIYTMLHERLHPFLASMLLFLFMAIPDLFAYSFVMLYDYSNMVFFFTGFYFLLKHFDNKQSNYFAFSVLLFGLATYIRVETLLLVAFLSPIPFYNYYKDKTDMKTIALRLGLLIGVPLAAYLICMRIFVHSFVPIPYNATNDLNHNLGDISFLFNRLVDMNTKLIFAKQGEAVYGYFIQAFLILLTADLVFLRRFNRESRFALLGVAVVYFGLPLLGYLFPLVDLMNTTKRGLFKLLPIMLLYMANSGLILKLSDWLKRLGEDKKTAAPKVKPMPVAPKQNVKVNPKKGKK